MNMLDRGSSPVDWCEPNYVHSSFIAEFFNTLSNFPLLLLPLLGIHLNKFYFNHVTASAKWIYCAFLIVGIFSTYYHATLSLIGQLLDELGILWVVTISVAVWLPRMRYVPKVLKKHSQRTSLGVIILAAIISALSFLKPAVNAYLLMVLSVPVMIGLFTELKFLNNIIANDLCLFTTGLWGAAVSVWMSDRMMCNIWQGIGFPYFHAIWHLASAFACYYAIVLCSYMNALAQAPYLKPVVRYFPENFHLRLIPYVTLMNTNYY